MGVEAGRSGKDASSRGVLFEVIKRAKLGSWGMLLNQHNFRNVVSG